MKIKKLFHWLYAILMLLPVFYIGGRVLYTIFNKNAKDSYSGFSETDYIEYTPIYSYNDMEVGKMYNLNTDNKQYIGTSTINIFVTDVEVLYKPSSIDISLTRQIRISYYTNNNYFRFFFYDVNNNNLANFIIYTQDSNLNLNFRFESFNPLSEFDNFKHLLSSYEYIQGNNTLDNAFEYSVNQLNEVPLFSWAQNSFLNEPFTYISGLFGIAADNPINTMLSYWLSISIIWLVFDLVMYVPLLVHRWIDKGGID